MSIPEIHFYLGDVLHQERVGKMHERYPEKAFLALNKEKICLLKYGEYRYIFFLCAFAVKY